MNFIILIVFLKFFDIQISGLMTKCLVTKKTIGGIILRRRKDEITRKYNV